jgi:hypothetical protein
VKGLAHHATQRNKILEVLSSAQGEWVPLPRISDCAAQYNARIYELRRLGFRIVNRTEEVAGVRHSCFRLEFTSTSSTAEGTARRTKTLPLFSKEGRP